MPISSNVLYKIRNEALLYFFSLALLLYYLGWEYVVHLLVVVCFLTFFSIRGKGEVYAGFLLFCIIQLVFTFVICIVYYFNLNPISVIGNSRSYVLEYKYIEQALMATLFLSTFVFVSMPKSSLLQSFNTDLKKHSSLRLLSYAVVVASSYYINRGSDIFSGGYGEAGFRASYWGGLPAIFVIFSSLWVLLQKKYDFKYFLMLNFVVFYWLISGNRSEVLVLALLGNVFFFNRFVGNKRWVNIAIISCLVLIFFFIFSAVGSLRSTGAITDLSWSGINPLKNLDGDTFHLPTFGSSVFSLIAAVAYSFENGYIYGSSYLGHLINTLPSFIPVPWERGRDVSSHVAENYEILGGVGLAGEAFINFSLFGVLFFSYGMSKLISFISVKQSSDFLYSWLLMSLFFYSQRFFLYGFVYAYNLLVFFIVIFVFIFVIRRLSSAN